MSCRLFSFRSLSSLAALALVASGCSSNIEDNETRGEAYCDNLDLGHCIFPYPTDHFRNTEGGKTKLVFPEGSLTTFDGQKEMDGSGFSRHDGFSAITPIFFTLDGATDAGVPQWDDIDGSLKASAKTVIIDAETGAFQSHWTEIDVFSTKTFDSSYPEFKTPVFALRLAERLDFGRRYIVAVQGLVDEDGQVVAPSPGFKALRDEEPSLYRGVGARRDRYETVIFPALKKAGLDRSKLQLAWEFTTATEENITGSLLAVRDAMYDVVGEEGPEYTITSVEEDPNEHIARLITGIAKVPSYVKPSSPGSVYLHLAYDENGKLEQQGFEDVEFEIQIPRSVWNGTEPGYVVNYGHGLNGMKNQAKSSWLRSQAEEQQFIVVAIDMKGMSGDLASVWIPALLKDREQVPYLSDKIHQGLVNHLAIVRMMKGRFAKDTDERFARADGSPVYKPNEIHYLGNSQGGTMGGVMMSIHRDIERGVLGVPGGAFSFLLTKTALFVEGMGAPVILDHEKDMRDFVATMGLIQLALDRVDAINFLHRVTENPFPNTPPHRVLLHVAREDAQVHNQISDLVARTSKSVAVAPMVRHVWGVETSTEDIDGNAMAEYDFALPNYENVFVPMCLDVTHGCLRSLPEAREQMDIFYRTGVVKNLCDYREDGACFVPNEWNNAHCAPKQEEVEKNPLVCDPDTRKE